MSFYCKLTIEDFQSMRDLGPYIMSHDCILKIPEKLDKTNITNELHPKSHPVSNINFLFLNFLSLLFQCFLFFLVFVCFFLVFVSFIFITDFFCVYCFCFFFILLNKNVLLSFILLRFFHKDSLFKIKN